MRESTAALLTEYVERGGTIIFGCRSGYKEETGQCYMRPLPGPIAELCGIEVEDFTLIGALQQALEICWNGGEALPGDSFADILRVTSDTAEVLAAYSSDYYTGKPALVRHRYGKGAAFYYRSSFNEAVAGALIDEMTLASPAADWAVLPEEVELAIRAHEGTAKRYAFLLNYAHTKQTVTILAPVHELITGTVLQGACTMQPFEVFVLEID